ncbi:hypothetical protein F511_14932 [Dorcoceras hygrometricum]|uniref:Uncharacterized protein n=1 Tax=Dorcoceras hygrometricum TaxID=472368 RepID=A0A2Z7BK56_9LAMI|nr:hypothetical protein F511_14932 [Dorcoceras hygrometricum]
MVDRTVKKAKGYGAQISVLLNSVPALTMGEATPFPSSNILSPKTVLTYITTNQTADTRGQSDDGGRTPVAIVKRASKSKKKLESTSDAPVEIVLEVVGSNKRPATEGSAPVVPKKRRTVKTKHSPSQENLDIVNIAHDVVPLQIVDPTHAAAAIKSPAPKRISRKRKLILPTGSDDESIATQKPVKDTHEVAVKPTDEVDMIIEQVLEETLDLGVSEETQGGQHVDEAAFTDDFGQWLDDFVSRNRLDDFVSRNNEPETVGTRTFTEAEGSTSPVVEKNLVQAVDSKQVGEEHMSIDDLLMQISEDMLLPSVTAAEITKIRFGGSIHIPGVQERDLYYASLPRISIHDKGIAILEEDEPVRGNPARETVELICGDVDFLVQLRDQVAAIRNEELEFQTKIAVDILSLSTQLGDLVEYIRGGDAKKGEGSSSRRPLPTPVHQSEGTGDAVRLTEPTQADIDNANRAILERMRNEDREMERRERSRGSRSGPYKRRRF